MKKAYIFLADGFEEVEALTVVDLLRRANIEIKTVSIMSDNFVTGSHKIEIKSDLVFDKAESFYDADVIIFPGGLQGTNNLKAHAGVNEIIHHYNDNNKLVAAICAAPSVLGNAGILKGKKAVCYPGFEPKLTGADVKYDNVCSDANVITSRGLGTAIDFALRLIETLDSASTAQEVAKSIVYSR